jgi:hypothetical protein
MPELRIVFDGPPGPESCRFVEVENEAGASINAGEWVERPDGCWELRIQQSPLPVAGYTAQPEAKVALVNEFKADEERLLRKLDAISAQTFHLPNTDGTVSAPDHRWIAIARTHFQEGFMALNRAVFQPQRIRLPEDE